VIKSKNCAVGKKKSVRIPENIHSVEQALMQGLRKSVKHLSAFVMLVKPRELTSVVTLSHF
jgi:hypothetical protein